MSLLILSVLMSSGKFIFALQINYENWRCPTPCSLSPKEEKNVELF